MEESLTRDSVSQETQEKEVVEMVVVVEIVVQGGTGPND